MGNACVAVKRSALTIGKKSQPAPPPPPDPKAVAGAQTGANVNSAIASGVIGNADQVGPYGSSKYSQTDTYSMTGPDGQTYQIPRYTQTTTLSPEQQQLYDQQTKLGSGLNNLALQQTDKLTGLLGTPVDAAGLPKLNQDFSADRTRVEQALFDRMNPQFERERDALETRLVNQGFQRGTEGFKNEMDSFGRNVNDARLGITAQGLQEQQGLYSMNADQYSRGLQSLLALRNQPINEISALMSGGQVSLPTASPYNAPSIGAANIGDYTYNSAALANQQWQTQQQAAAQKQSALYGALGGVAGAGLYGLAGGKLGGLFGPKQA